MHCDPPLCSGLNQRIGKIPLLTSPTPALYNNTRKAAVSLLNQASTYLAGFILAQGSDKPPLELSLLAATAIPATPPLWQSSPILAPFSRSCPAPSTHLMCCPVPSWPAPRLLPNPQEALWKQERRHQPRPLPMPTLHTYALRNMQPQGRPATQVICSCTRQW